MDAQADPLDAMYESKAEAYSAFGTGLVATSALKLLPPEGSVLDLGCASGGLLALLRDRASFTAGVELSSAAARAADVADQVVQARIESPDLPFEPGSFDLVVMADVLEHLVDPPDALARAVSWVKPGGAIVVSVPNIAHWHARLVLLRGEWRSEETGLFDSGHLRFFNVERLDELVREAGLVDGVIRPVVPALRNHFPALSQRLPQGARDGMERAWQAIGARRPNLFGFQLVATARRPSAPAE